MAKRCEESNYKKCDKIEANQSGSLVTSVAMKSEGGTSGSPFKKEIIAFRATFACAALAPRLDTLVPQMI
jgi:hypothetical protein